VDGKPRYDRVKSFLGSRGIHLPYGDPRNSPERETICGIGNRKEEMVLESLKTHGVEVYEGSVALGPPSSPARPRRSTTRIGRIWLRLIAFPDVALFFIHTHHRSKGKSLKDGNTVVADPC
jgi:hypothetical protein